MKRSVLVVAGEVSGDMHAAAVVAELRRRAPETSFWGIGGDHLRAAGMEILHDVREMAVMGLPEVLRRYGFFRRVFAELAAEAARRRPDLVLLVDYPGFNLRFAARAKALGLRVAYFICPQVWAWHRSRIPSMAARIDRLLVLLPFEKPLFDGTGLRADFVGHPLVDAAAAARMEPTPDLPWCGTERVALLPGSRRQEIERILPALLDAAAALRARRPDAGFIVACPSDAIARQVESLAGGARPEGVRVVAGRTRHVLRQARAAWVASGTATLEAALMACPMVVVYRTSPLTWLLGRLLVRVPHIGLVNIVAGREVCPEYIQGAATPDALADALEPLIGDTPERAAMVRGLEEAAARLGPGGAAARAAACLQEEMEHGAP